MFVTVKARVYTDATGVYTEIPALLTPAGVLEPLRDYCLARSHDRKLDRELIADYERIVEEILVNLDLANHEAAIELASIPDQIRGFGHVRERYLASARQRQADTTLDAMAAHKPATSHPPLALRSRAHSAAGSAK